MPQFYFHIREQGQLIPDEDGMMLRDLEAARQEALKSCLDLVRNRLHHRVDELRIEIADGGGKVIESVNVRDQVASPGC
jgi:hypothetical protein